MTSRFGFIPIHSQLMKNEEAFNKIAGSYIKNFERKGGESWTKENLKNPKPLFYMLVTGGTEELLLNLRNERNKHIQNEPVIILAHPTHNSLPASLEVLARLQQDNEKGRIFYLNGPNDKNGFSKIERTLRDLEVWFALKRMRIGMVGTPSDWLVASNPDLTTLQETWGPTVLPISMDEVKKSLQSINTKSIKTILESLSNSADEVQELLWTDLEENVKVYNALKQLIEGHKLDAVTVRCFDLVLDYKITGCFALAQLNDEGMIAGCEGDLVSTVGMIWTHEMLGQIPWMANPVQWNDDSNTIWLAHCTVPISIVKKYTLRSHFESGIGVGIQGTFSNGPVTLLRIGGVKMDKIWIAEGEIIQAGKAEDLCRTQAEVKLNNGTIRDLLQAPLGNHLILVKGHHLKQLTDWWKIFIDK
ncbi:MAG: fucose isomerase [Ignavibacteria bacterium]|nr:fucose isomerase [Ignavibacteria bacterium]MBT8392268.1 fucose isomerase [Ignavibacteria bacterium]NNJ53614.1 fucose isomerase [Ignavibacteriaceae bacterium]NNL20397.1 fucose isomerase [Ignavibacteriaceae bacterium]